MPLWLTKLSIACCTRPAPESILDRRHILSADFHASSSRTDHAHTTRRVWPKLCSFCPTGFQFKAYNRNLLKNSFRSISFPFFRKYFALGKFFMQQMQFLRVFYSRFIPLEHSTYIIALMYGRAIMIALTIYSAENKRPSPYITCSY